MYVFQLATNLLDYYCYACLLSREAYCDWQPTFNFELKFLCADRFSYEDSEIISVCLYSEERNCPGFVNISLTVVIDTWMERSSRVLHHGNAEMWKFFKKLEIDEIEFCPYP